MTTINCIAEDLEGYKFSDGEVWCFDCAINTLEDLAQTERKDVCSCTGKIKFNCSNCGIEFKGHLKLVDYFK